MKLTSAQVERALTQFEAQPIPESHPAIRQLNDLFGDHTFFIDGNGLSIVELTGENPSGSRSATVVSLAHWSEAKPSTLEPHEPEATDVVVALGPKH
jgi:hypothetical protein